MERANPAASVLNSVDHDVKTSRNSVRSRTLVVFIRWIRNVQRKMETTLRISAHRSCRSLPAFSCRLLSASRLLDSDPKRFGRSLSDYHSERPIIASLIFPRRCDRSWFRLARNSNCDAHRGKSPKHKSKLGRRTLSCVSRCEVSIGFQSNTTAPGFCRPAIPDC